jgi:hypothetical protein
MLPLNLAELEVSGLALVTAIDDCPPIASGEGSVVTAPFITREVHVVASVDVLGAYGTVETITGTTIHPVWSVDRQEWVPLGELTQGEHLLSPHPSPLRGRGTEGEGAVTAIVLSVSLSRVSQPVYNIEVHGEHVYQVGELGLLVHNANECFRVMSNVEYAGARLGKWFDNPNDLDWAGYKWVWNNSDEAASWLRYLENSGEAGGLITRIDTLRDITDYQGFLHPPQGIARLVPLEELGKAIRIFP